MFSYSGYLSFRIDPLLASDLKKLLEALLSEFKEAEISELVSWDPPSSTKLYVDFISEGSLHFIRPGLHLKVCLLDRNQGLFSFGQNLEDSQVDVILDDSLDIKQIERLVAPSLNRILLSREEELFALSVKNLKKFESKVKTAAQDHEADPELSPENLLNYTQLLVDLERDLIHSDDIEKMGKILRLFTKNNIEKSKFQLFTSRDLYQVEHSKNLLPLPGYKGDFLALEMNWEDQNDFRQIKRYFFYSTLVSFFLSQKEMKDPFFNEALWMGVLDSIPFPVALLSKDAEVFQHNGLFAKLNFPPLDCLKLKLREKILINDIPYNIFKKEVFHLDEKKILYVFFTESFFLKGDGNLTPSGQELGIISSSIAHELNNPIAGIQAALSLLMLDDELNDEAKHTLVEMKSGAMRCKQLIETFLGFSRANPGNIQTLDHKLSPVEVCYQQAGNLLRFRTVESGIRFSLEYSKHTDFRAQVNLSLLTMTFYLIMGELMTLYSHQLLVARTNQIEKVIKGEIIESSQEIQIQLHELNISTLSLSKLIQNLLTIENFVLQVSDYSLRFIYNPPRDA